MAYRGRGRGRGGFGNNRSAKQLPFEMFPEIVGLGKAEAEYPPANIQLIKWSSNMQKFWNSSPYFYEDKKECIQKVESLDIERHSDRNLQATKARPPLWHFIKLDTDHLPAELAAKGTQKHVAKKVRWKPYSDSKKMDLFEKLEKKLESQEGKEKKESDDEEENEEELEIESSDEDDDYITPEEFDDDEDDANMAPEEDEGPLY